MTFTKSAGRRKPRTPNLPATLRQDSRLVSRFLKHVANPLRPGDCWNWRGATNALSYGIFKVHGQTLLAHRVSWSIHCGNSPPTGLCVCHKCDNPRCVSPTHLWIGSNSDNIKDKISKNRHLRVLTPEQRKEIFQRALLGESQVCIARDYPVSVSTIGNVIRQLQQSHE
jgi:hypothetical protein